MVKKVKAARPAAPARGALVALRAELEAIDAGEVKPPPIPADRLVGEGLALAETAARYEDELAAVGVGRALVGGLAARAQALAEAQARLLNLRGLKRSEAEVALEERAVELRADLVAAGRFALRGDANAQKVLDLVQEGEGLDDLVQDLKTLAAFADKHRDALARVGLEPAVAGARARKLAAELEGHVAARRAVDGDEVSALELRDRAATHLWAAMAEVRAAGAYAFRKNPRALARFRSAYNAQHRAKRRPGEGDGGLDDI